METNAKTWITFGYEGDSPVAHRFRYGLLAADILSVLYVVATTTFLTAGPLTKWLDIAFGIYIGIDYAARFWISRKKAPFLFTPLNIADVVVMFSFVAPYLGREITFLRALRILRLLRSYRLLKTLRQDFDTFRRHEDIIISGINLVVFIFLMTELVLVSQAGRNPGISSFLDALYFTVTTLTTTGFGDVTMQGRDGRAIAIVIMIFGVSLFLRLIQTMFRPSKVRFTCAACGLYLHESDAVHCKHCGKVLAIPSDGDV
jgi:voltage-gated potassium channel